MAGEPGRGGGSAVALVVLEPITHSVHDALLVEPKVELAVPGEQGAATDSGRVSAQVEVTPRVSVKADVGARNRGGVGIMWKKDY